jgi:hypothetical protein
MTGLLCGNAATTSRASAHASRLSNRAATVMAITSRTSRRCASYLLGGSLLTSERASGMPGVVVYSAY